jgi:hypothetical protein
VRGEVPVHVLPISDQIEHTLDEDCPCGPTTEAVFRDDGSNGWLVTHHSLDGREQRETEQVTCGYCGDSTDVRTVWGTPKEYLRWHWRGACPSLPWWRRWFR